MREISIKLACSAHGAEIKEYNIGAKGYVCDDFAVETIINDSKYNIKLLPNAELSQLSILLELAIDTTDVARFYSNGYQSWTLSREYGKADKYSGIAKVLLPAVKAEGGYLVGDYSFVEYPKSNGVFNSTSHCYTREEDSSDITLYGSLDDRSGYTYFTCDLNNKVLFITKDLEGIAVNSEYTLLDIAILSGEYNSVFDEYFECLGVKARATTKLKGYTSWYNYYRKIDENILLRDLESITSRSNEEINIFQIDDGYQPFIGDLTAIDKVKFPSGLTPLADTIHSKGLLAGLWTCPFGVTAKSECYRQHFDWILKDVKGKPIKVGAAWGGFYCLDFYNQDVRDYIRSGIDTMLNEWGFDMLKMDFLYCVCVIPQQNKTRATVMYEAMEFLRECAGDKLILGCGVPLMPSFGVVDYCRIGADVSLGFKFLLDYAISREMLSTRKTMLNSLFRRYLDGRAFGNDTDVFVLREKNNSLTVEQRLLLAIVNKLCGSVLFCSDNVSEYDATANKIFNFVMDNQAHRITDINIISRREVIINYVMGDEIKSLSYDFMNGKPNNSGL